MSIYIDNVRFPLFPVNQADPAAISQSYSCGPMLIGGDLYIVLLDAQGASPTYALLVYKSTDDGSTWTLVSGTSHLGDVFFPKFSFGLLGTSIWFLYASDSGGGSAVALHIVAFDTATSTWGTPSNMPVSPAGTDLRAWDMTVQGDGTCNVIYTANVANVFSTWLIRYSGGVWGSHTQLTSANWEQSGVFMDSDTNTTHLFISPRDIFGSGPLVATNHLAIDSNGTVGPQTTLLPAPGAANQRLYPSFDQGCIWGDRIVVPYTRNNNTPAVFIGTPISSPVWSSSDIPFPDDPLGQFSFTGFGKTFALTIDGNLNIFWCTGHWDVDFNNLSVFLIRSIDTGSGLDSGEVIYDSSTDTISPSFSDPSSVDIAFPSIGITASGLAVTFQATMNTTGIIGYDALTNLYLAVGVVPPTPLSITCGGSPSGLVGTSYSNFLPASGGTPPYTFAITSGSLPPGLVLNSTSGEISGTPTTPGTYPFTVQVTDSLAATASVDCSIIIISTLLITCGDPPIGIVGVFYSHTFPVSGGVPPYTFTLVTGFLPPGLTIDSTTGIISGIPTQGGTYAFTVNVRDAALTSMNVICSITIGSVSVGCTNIQSGTVGVPYSQSFPATGGTPPYTFTVIAGQVPFGLLLDAATGVLSGTPLAPGTYQVVIEVTDVNGITDTAICVQIIGCQ